MPLTTKALIPALVLLLTVQATAGLAMTPAPTDASAADHGSAPDLGPEYAQVEHGEASASGSATASDAGDGGTDARNVTRLSVDAEDPYLRLQPGATGTYTVTVRNHEDEAVTLDPHVASPAIGSPPVPDGWVTVDGPEELDPDGTAEFTVEVSVPDDAEIGTYRSVLALTDQTVTYPGRPAAPVHAAPIRVEVWREPAVYVRSDTYVHGQVEAGESMTREIVIENTGDEPVPLGPTLRGDRGVCRGDCPGELDRTWLDIDAPSRIEPGERATVTIAVEPPSSAEAGRYDAELELGIDDPNRPDRDAYWQRVRLTVEVWHEPSSPIETTARVDAAATDLTLTLTPHGAAYRSTDGEASGEPASFDVEFVSPNGTVVTPDRVRVTDRGTVDMGAGARPSAPVDEDGVAVRDGGREVVYRLDDPAAGDWTVRIAPRNVIRFGYEITRHEAS